MFDSGIIKQIKEAMPEAYSLKLKLDSNELPVGLYEKLNGLIVQNNILDDKNNSIAIFRPAEDMLDIYLLVVMGIAAYKKAVANNAKLRINDFKIGELVEYEGKVASYMGFSQDQSDGIERFTLAYTDQYKTRESLPLRYFSSVSKYSGSKVAADPYDIKRAKGDTKDALKLLLGLHAKDIRISGYPGFLVSSSRPGLVSVLKDLSINGVPFFEMFPSVKCTSNNKIRLGRDKIKRAFMFYFVSNLSTADDVLHSEPGIKTLFLHTANPSMRFDSLVSSMRNQSGLEDIYWLRTFNQLDSITKVEEGLDFKVWLWTKKDYKEILDVDGGQTLVSRLANYSDETIEIDYPAGFSIEKHKRIQQILHHMFQESDLNKDTGLLNLSIRAAGVSNRIFQSCAPLYIVDQVMENSGKKALKDDLESLLASLGSFGRNTLSEDLNKEILELLSLLEESVECFEKYSGKLDRVASLLMQESRKKVSVLLKYSELAEAVKNLLIEKFKEKGSLWHDNRVLFTDNLQNALCNSEEVIWTFKPQLKETLMLAPSVEKTFAVLYPLQKRELDYNFACNGRLYQKYLEPAYRSEVLRLATILPARVDKETASGTDYDGLIDLDKEISSAAFQAVLQLGSSQARNVKAHTVTFSDGSYAFFQSGNNIKVLSDDRKAINTKTVGTLSEGDNVVFLRDSKRTVFEELVEFYEHKPEIVRLVKLSEMWRNALQEYSQKNYLNTTRLKKTLEDAGLKRHVVTIESWLDGNVICPSENNYQPLDIIAKLTGDSELIASLPAIKSAARKIHALRIKIGHYLSMKITQSYISPESMIDDPVLRNKLDEMSRQVKLAQVLTISDDARLVPSDMVNKPLTLESIQ